MDLSVVAFLIAAAAALALPFVIYRRRELSVRGRWALATLRAGVLVLTLLLLWNPQLPGRVAPQSSSDTWLLVDRSLSMTASGEGGWETALDRAGELAGQGPRIATFGDGVEVIEREGLEAVVPDAASSRLTTALERAAEAGARRIVVLSDFRIPDVQTAASVIGRARASVSLEAVPSDVRNAGVAELTLPRTIEAGVPVPLQALVQGEGANEGDSVRVEVREDDRLVDARTVAMPPPGRQQRLRVEAPAPAREGRVRYAVRALLDGDVFSDDDERVAYVDVGPEVQGVVLVSLRPTWEPRFVLPVLEQVTGLGAQGFLRLTDGRYLPAGSGDAERTPVDEGVVRQAVDRAALVVLHGVGAGAPAWLAEAAAGTGRLLLFAHDREGAALAGAEVSGPVAGEWYAVPELGPSPLAADLSGADFSGLPPLSGLLLAEDLSAPAPLRLERPGGGEPVPALILVRDEGRRRVAVLASGFWRWGFRDGPARDAYRRLWAAASGWLLANEAVAGAPGVRPAEAVVVRGRGVRWVAPGFAGDTVHLTLRRPDEMAQETTVTVPADETFETGVLPPGTYAWEARSAGQEAPDELIGSGTVDVERFTRELLLPPAPLAEAIGQSDEPTQATAIGRPLRTHPLPYLVLLALLCVEWIGRRRLGLR